MLFSQDILKSSSFSIKAENGPTLNDIQASCSSGIGSLFSQKTSQFLPIYGLDNQGDSKLNSIKYFFPSSDKIDVQLSDPAKLVKSVKQSLPTSSNERIEGILEQIKKLSSIEKLLLYLKLPTGKNNHDPTKLPENPLGSRQEIVQTIAWIKTHLKEDKDTSIPKQDVYNEYLIHCEMADMKPLSTADFGKVMKQVYPKVRPRRLGTRGNSRYCYSGMSCRGHLPPPVLPMINSSKDEGGRTCAWAAQVLGTPITSLSELEAHLASRGLPTAGRPLPPPNATDENTYMRSSKISKAHEERFKNSEKIAGKTEETCLLNTSVPERSKGRKRNIGAKKAPNTSKSDEPKAKKPKLEPKKVPIPRLIQQGKEDKLMPCPRKPAPKPLQPKQEQVFLDPTKKDHGNIVESAPRLLYNFVEPTKKMQTKSANANKKSIPKFLESTKKGQQKSTEPLTNILQEGPVQQVKNDFQVPIEEPKVSQLRMLLERKGGKTQVKRRVSFELPFQEKAMKPDSLTNNKQKRPLQRSNSLNLPGGKVAKQEMLPPISTVDRSQSLPMLLPHDTPIPTELIDFGFDDDPNLLIIDESSESLLIESGINSDNFNAIFSIISEMETNPHSYENISDYSQSINQQIIPSTSTFFDGIDYDVSLANLNVDVAQLTTDIM